MNIFSCRIMLVSVIVVLFFVPLYAYHGTQFLSKTMELNAAEGRLGEMAADRTLNYRIKDFAQMIVKDHKQGLEKVNELLDARTAVERSGTTAVRSTKNVAHVQLTAEHQQTFNRLSALSGADFDLEFLAVMIRGHREAIREFEAETRVHGNAVTSRKQTTAPSGQETARQKPNTPDQRKYSRADIQRDVDTAEFARDTLPSLRHHLQQAEEIQKELRGR
jgi:putative membrane protein